MRPFHAIVLKNELIAQDFVMLTLSASPAFELPVRPGQFAHLTVPHAPEHLLRRPISIMSASCENKTLTLGIEPKGEGTHFIAALSPGQELELLAPLGHGFDAHNAHSIWLIGGGVGVAPMRFAAEFFGQQASIVSYLGFRCKTRIHSLDAFASCGETVLCTDDGSAGYAGTVVDAMRERNCLPELVMACGPLPMLRAVQDFCLEKGVSGQLSLEQRMGCGYGACLTCACKVHRANDVTTFARVCADGPVFDVEKVVL
ncbi:MAG: dihydroorotate dehydrogenase electron transfer subunit [Oscillospiraceae bacterium]